MQETSREERGHILIISLIKTFIIYNIFNSFPRSGQFYYMFGFVFLAFVILILVSMETSILLCYFHLCAEDYRWWWRSFFATATTGLYLFLFSLHYFLFKTQIVGSLSYLIYFGYTGIIVLLFSIFTGMSVYHVCILLHIHAVFCPHWSALVGTGRHWSALVGNNHHSA